MPTDATSGEQSRARPQDAPRLGTIVVASDGSDDSAGALTVARELAHHLGIGLELVSVIEPANMLVPPLQPAHAPLHRGSTRIHDRRERLRILCGDAVDGRPRCSTRILLGDPPESIARAARCHRAPLVVTGRVAHGTIDRAMRRETPLATARAGQVPVLSVGSAVSGLPRSVVIAVGEGDAAERLAPLAPLALALCHDALVVHLVAIVSRDSPPWERDARPEDDERQHDAQRALARAAAAWTLPSDVPVQTHVLTGETDATLAAFVAMVKADLLVIGQARRAPGCRFPIALPLADLATRMYRSLSCATLIVPVERHRRPGEQDRLRSGRECDRDQAARSRWPHAPLHLGF
jgi:nucleotide-binding universal stress UspA family protein